MKICPLVTQALILEEEEKDLLIGEVDNQDLEKDAEKNKTTEEQDNEIFLNPDVDPSSSGDVEDTPANVRNVRFIAKSYRGEVECLGRLCRFHDDESSTCRFEMLIERIADQEQDQEPSEEIQSIKTELEKSWEFQQKSTGDMLELFKELKEKNDTLESSLSENFEKKWEELRGLVSQSIDENKVIIESMTDTLAETTEGIESRIDAKQVSFDQFKLEVSEWQELLDRKLKSIGDNLDESKKLVEGLSESHSEVMKLVKNQKTSMENDEKKQQASEARALNNAGVMAYHNGRYEKAIEMFENAIKLDPEFTEAFNNLGLTYTEINEEKKATEAFKKAIEFNPELAATYNNLGYVFYRLGSYQEAIEMYNEAIGRSKNNSSAYTNLGNAYYKMDRIEEAIEAWKKAVEIDPANEKARRNLKKFHAEVEKTS